MCSSISIEAFVQAADAIGLRLTAEQAQRVASAAEWLARLSHGSGISGYETADTALMHGMAPALAYFALDTPREGLLVDIGAGSGALGATIAILEENLHVHLVDRAERAYTACEILAARLRLPNLSAYRTDANAVSPGSYDAAVLRALAPAHEALPTARRLVRPGGRLVAYHRPEDPGFLKPEAELIPLDTVSTVLPGLVATAYAV